MGTARGRMKDAAARGRTSAASAGQERTWVPLPDPAPGATAPIYVSFPAPPDGEALAEAMSHLAGLEARKQIVREPDKPAPGATHQLEIDVLGRKRLVRKRFSR